MNIVILIIYNNKSFLLHIKMPEIGVAGAGFEAGARWCIGERC